jgi:hypothetical protein
MSGRRWVGALVCAPLGAALLTGCDIIPASGWALDLVTDSADGADGGNAPTHFSDVSADGTRVLFTTTASNLEPNDTNDNVDVYMRDLDSGTTTLVSSNTAGTDAGNSGSHEPSFSPDGTKVVYASTASDLGPIDTDLASDIYLRDMTTGAVARIDPGPDSCGGAHSGGPTFSPDGNKVAFTRSWFLESNASDVFAHNADGTDAAHAFGASMSPDGTKGGVLQRRQYARTCRHGHGCI